VCNVRTNEEDQPLERKPARCAVRRKKATCWPYLKNSPSHRNETMLRVSVHTCVCPSTEPSGRRPPGRAVGRWRPDRMKREFNYIERKLFIT
jgi:hypothetical protein